MIHLYVKHHNQTGLKYFGKTTKDPFKYVGSGKYWLKHLRKHGRDIRTEVIGSFESEPDATAAAMAFSTDNHITDSTEWANLIIENALDGAPVGHPGHIFTEEQRTKISQASKARWADPAYKEALATKHRAAWTTERREAQARRLRGVKRPEHSLALKGRKASARFLAFTRSPRSQQHKDAISAALTGRSSQDTSN